MPVTPFLALEDCAECGLTYLQAGLYANEQYPIDQPIRIAPFLLDKSGQAKAILANIPLFHIELTKYRQYTARRFYYHFPPRRLAQFEKTTFKAGTHLGIAALHIHRHNPPGIPVPDLTNYSKEKDTERHELLATAIERHPHLESMLRDILDPPPF